jgi:hypothetical protein
MEEEEKKAQNRQTFNQKKQINICVVLIARFCLIYIMKMMSKSHSYSWL